MEAIIVLSLGTCLGLGLFRLAEMANDLEREQFLESVGGPESPWLEAPPSTVLDPEPGEFEPGEMHRIYPDSQQPLVSAPVSAPVSAQVSVPSPSPSPPASPHEAQPTTPPGFHRPPLTGGTTGDTAGEVVPPVATVAAVALVGDDWLEDKAVFFPIDMPPEVIDSYADQLKHNEATDWIRAALAVRVSQTKIATVMFGHTKNSKGYKKTVEMIKEVKNG